MAQIMVKGLTGGGTITVDGDATDTTKVLKKKIQAKTGIPSAHQRLIFSGKQLDDSLTLDHYGCGKGSTVELVGSLRGGGGGGWGVSLIFYTTKKTTVVEGAAGTEDGNANTSAGAEEGTSATATVVVNNPAPPGRTTITEEDSGYGIRFHVD